MQNDHKERGTLFYQEHKHCYGDSNQEDMQQVKMTAALGNKYESQHRGKLFDVFCFSLVVL